MKAFSGEDKTLRLHRYSFQSFLVSFPKLFLVNPPNTILGFASLRFSSEQVFGTALIFNDNFHDYNKQYYSLQRFV